MLLVPDLHVHTKVVDSIVDALRTFINTYPGEENIIFVGDYVYQFHYDRASLMKLFHFFLECYHKGKTLYILAGNHDWIGSSFVFHEAQEVFSLLNQHTSQRIHFITHPQIFDIEGKKCLFLPHVIDEEVYRIENPVIDSNFSSLLHSVHKSERMSGAVNMYLESVVRDISPDEHDPLLVFHHYYIADTQLPGLKNRFAFRDNAISPLFLEHKSLRLISGHIHQPFGLGNALCVGSLRSTSPLESNQYKAGWRYDPDSDTLEAYLIHINPYFVFESGVGKLFDQGRIDDLCVQLNQELRDHFNQSVFTLTTRGSSPDLKDIVLSISSQISYEELDNLIPSALRTQLKDVKIKRKSDLHTVDMEVQNPGERVSSWQSLLKEYLSHRFPQEYQSYYTLLEESQIL